MHFLIADEDPLQSTEFGKLASVWINMTKKLKSRILPCKTSIVSTTIAQLSSLKLQIDEALD